MSYLLGVPMVLRYTSPQAPLQPLEVVKWPFDKTALDTIGPLPKSMAGFQFILRIIDYATCYPEVVLMKTVTAPKGG